jgi:hypothetical protein
VWPGREAGARSDLSNPKNVAHQRAVALEDIEQEFVAIERGRSELFNVFVQNKATIDQLMIKIH